MEVKMYELANLALVIAGLQEKIQVVEEERNVLYEKLSKSSEEKETPTIEEDTEALWKREYHELLSCVKPLEQFSASELSRISHLVKSDFDDALFKLHEVIDRLNEWFNGR